MPTKVAAVDDPGTGSPRQKWRTPVDCLINHDRDHPSAGKASHGAPCVVAWPGYTGASSHAAPRPCCQPIGRCDACYNEPDRLTSLGSESTSTDLTPRAADTGPEAAGFSAFRSHNSRDKPAVELLAGRLKRAGSEPWLDAWCLMLLAWQDEIAAGVAASSSFAFFVGRHGEGDWAREELALAQDRAAKNRDNFRLFRSCCCIFLSRSTSARFHLSSACGPGLTSVTVSTMCAAFRIWFARSWVSHSARPWPLSHDRISCPYRGLERLTSSMPICSLDATARSNG